MPSLTDIYAQRTIDETIFEHEEEILELEERVVQLKAAILALKTRRNTHSAISTLPIELIASIFLHAKGYAQAQSSAYSRHQVQGWLNISPVCRQWRAIVLDTPRLWRCIDLSWEVQRTSEFLKRSKSVPLQVQCRSHCYSWVDFEPAASIVMRHIERIQELDVTVSNRDPSSLQQLLGLNPSGSVPALEILRLKSWSDARITLPTGKFWQDVPALRVLELEEILVSQLPMLPRLSRLVLQSSPGLSPSWLIKALQNTPLMEEIDISGLLSDLGPEIPTHTQVSLPKLKFLRIRTDHLNSSKVFDYLHYPRSAIVDFACYTEPDLEELTDLSSLERICFTTGDGTTPCDSIQIHAGVKCVEVQVSPSESDAESPPYPRLTFTVPLAEAVLKCVQLCSALPLSTAHMLSLSLGHHSIAEWLTLFPLCRQVTTLRLSRWSTDILTGLLTTSDSQRPLLEKLETLIVRDCAIHYSPDEPDNTMVNAMFRLLKQRKELGMAIRELQMERCNITRDIINEFEGLVEVQWDRWGAEEGSEGSSVCDEEPDGPEDSGEVSDQ